MNDVTSVRTETRNNRANVRSATILLGNGLAGNREFVQKVLEGEACQFLHADNSDQILHALNSRLVDLVILPAAGSTIQGLDCCRRIKADRKTELVPVLVVTGEGI